MARFVLVEAFPWRVSDGFTEAVRLAGGGRKPYSGLRGFTDWRSGVASFPLFVASVGFNDTGWSGVALPQTTQLRVFPSDEALRATLLSKYQWRGAYVEIRSGDDDVPNVYVMELCGIVDNITVADGAIVLTVADASRRFDVPVVAAKFAGTGGVEGPAEAEGRPKRRSWGYVRNVEGFLLEKANNIFEFGDLAFPLNAFVAVRDMGRDASPAPTVLAWQGSIAATFAALQTSAPADGSCVAAPSIACVKWWTQPVGPLTADIEGEVGSGYVNKIADIAKRLVDTLAPNLGGELVTNGDFSSATGWTLTGAGVSIAGGVLNLGTTQFNGGQRLLDSPIANGESVQLSGVVANWTAMNPNVFLTRGFGGDLAATPLTANGAFSATYSHALTDPVLSVGIFISAPTNNATAPTIDSISVRRIGVGVVAADVTAINTARPSVSGVHVGDENETLAAVLDRLLVPCNVLWGVNPDGSVRLGEVQLTTSAETLTAVDVERLETFKPIWQVKLGYKKNHREHSDGEISAALLLANVTGPSEPTVFHFDYLGAANSGQFPRDLTFKLMGGDGSVITAGVAWQYRVLSGTVNGFTNASGLQNMSGTGIGTLAVASLGTDTASVEVKAVFSGETRTATASLSRQYGAAPTGGGGGGGGGPQTLASKSSGFTTINSTTFTVISGTLTGTMPTGLTTANLNASLNFDPATGSNGSATVELKWQRSVSGVWTDIGSPAVVSGTSQWFRDAETGETSTTAASITNNKSDTGLTAGTSYDWRLVARLTSGTRSHNVTGIVSITA
jgi:hypothetical protein